MSYITLCCPNNYLTILTTNHTFNDKLLCCFKSHNCLIFFSFSETELFLKLQEHANTLVGADAYCFKAFAEALEVIPYTLAENAGLNPISTVTELRNKHAQGEVNSGINVRKGMISNILDENVVQPLLVSTSAITLAAECVVSIMKIDDIVNTIR